MQTEQTQRKAKRKLSNISFEHHGAHVALTNTNQGGPANGHDYALVLKAVNFSQEAIEKMQQVRVTMELPDFLEKFFFMWEEDAKVLATMLGYKEPVETQAMEDEEAQAEMQDWIKSRMESFEILKSLYDAENIPEQLSTLDEDQYLSVLNDQQKLEKAFKKAEKLEKAKLKESKSTAEVVKAEGDDTPQNASVGSEVEESTSVTKQQNKEVSMTQEVKTVEQEVLVEMVEKSALENVQKALEEQKVALEKAMETIAQFEAEKKAAIEKQRLADVKAAVANEAHAEVLFKAVKDVEDEQFVAVVKALAEMTAAVEKSDLFVEKGATVEEQVPVKENAVEKLLKAKFQK